MSDGFGITETGLKVALDVKRRYRERQPICLADDGERMLIPEYLLNTDLDLSGFEDPLPLALVAARDPEPPMALAAVARLGPKARGPRLIQGVFGLLGETSRHPLVRECVDLVTDSAFSPVAMARVRDHASRVVADSRRQYTRALRRNLQALIEGTIAPRLFVEQFFALTEAGNLRHDIRKRLVVSLLLSETVRPSIKFMMLENFFRMPRPIRSGIIAALLQAERTRHVEVMKEELRWIIENQAAAD